MKVIGKVFSGAMRGEPLMEKYYPRLKALCRFEPYRGTMDVLCSERVDLEPFSFATMEHVLPDGKHVKTALIAHVKIREFSPVFEISEKSIKKSSEEEEWFDCCAVQFLHSIHGRNVLELISDKKIKDALDLVDGDKIEIWILGKVQKHNKIKEFIQDLKS